MLDFIHFSVAVTLPMIIIRVFHIVQRSNTRFHELSGWPTIVRDFVKLEDSIQKVTVDSKPIAPE